MTDVLTPEQRRQCMRSIRQKNTTPELLVRRLLRSLRLSYRLHVSDLPGTPDIVLRRFRKAVLVHGCFWHRHSCANGRVLPKNRAEFWLAKLSANVARDGKQEAALRALGYDVLVVWECETRDPETVLEALAAFAGPPIA